MLIKKLLSLLTLLIFAGSSTLSAANNTFLDYQNYNHGYCPDCNCAPCSCTEQPAACEQPCNPCAPAAPSPSPCVAAPSAAPCNPCAPAAPCAAPCDPCAPVCGAECGISWCAIAVGVAALVAAAVIIFTAGHGDGHPSAGDRGLSSSSN